MQTDLWQKIRNGDSSAMATLYRECYQEIYVSGFCILPDKEKLKDIIHEIFAETWQKRNQAGEILNIKAYLKTSVRNRILKQIREDQLTERIDDQPEMLKMIEYDYEHLLIASQGEQARKVSMKQAIMSLTPTQRQVISLRYYQTLSYEAIARQLELKPRTVYNHVHEAIKSLRKSLKSI